MTASVLDEVEVICATTIGCGHRLLESRKFPIVLMDEATQATEPSAWYPSSRGAVNSSGGRPSATTAHGPESASRAWWSQPVPV